MKNYFFLTATILLISCSSSSNKDLELENAKLKLKVYEDSLRNLNKVKDQIESNKEQKTNQEQSDNQKLIDNEDSKAKERIGWLCKYVTNSHAPVIFRNNTTETRFMVLEKNGSFSIKTYQGSHNEKLSSHLIGNLSDLASNSVRIYNDEDNGHFYIHINCVSGNCIHSKLNSINDFNIVSFGPYNPNFIPDFPTKLKKAFEDVIFDLNKFDEVY